MQDNSTIDPSEFNDDSDLLNDSRASGNKTLEPEMSPSVLGEQDLGGTNLDLSADDDALEMAHSMGIGLDADDETPQELNIAEDVAKAEKAV